MADFKNFFLKRGSITIVCFFVVTTCFFFPNPVSAKIDPSGEVLYKYLLTVVAEGNNELIEELNTSSRLLDWSEATAMQFKGNLRLLSSSKEGTDDETRLFFIRNTDGEIFILSIPDREDPGYQNLEELMENKLIFDASVIDLSVRGKEYQFARFNTTPIQPVFDKIFRIAIILMLFFVMVGMGLTLTGKDFAVLILKPKAIFVGELLQFGIMPLVAVAFGYLMGFHENYPYIFVGMVLITATPGGVTSNLMTHYAKGDVALSVSITSISTVLSIIFLPLLLNAYCSNIPEVKVPTSTITLTIVVLVIIPLGLGMLYRRFKEKWAKKFIPVFNILGVIALLFLIVAGVISNIEGFADTERYGFKFYSMIVLLTFSGMIVGGFVPKIFKVSNYQIRAISLETGLRNASLAMTITLLIQDSMGDFHASMFWVSGMFGITMYLAGIVAIKVYPAIFPIKN